MKKRRSARRGWRLAALGLASLLAAALCQSVPAAVDTSRACTLTVAPGGEEYAEDLAEAGVVFDLYKVADVIPDTASDGFSYGMTGAYADLSVPEDVDAEGWKALAQQAARTALAEESTEEPLAAEAAVGTPVTVNPGLYLLLAHGSGETDYVTTVTDEAGEEKLATTAHSRTNTYTFAPELISLPTKEADAEGYVGTDNPGDWIYDLSVQLKPEQSPRYGSLAVVKTLESYEASEPATFVFQVDGYTDDTRSERIYSDVVSLTFTEPGTRQALIEGKIPVGTYVVVTEVYSGASYTLTTDPEQTAVLEANELVSVSFTNTYDNHRRGGHGITNAFTYREEGGSWQWEQLPDNGAE